MRPTATNPDGKKTPWSLRMLGILTSRWMYVVVIALAFAAVRIQSHALFIVLYIATGLIVALMLIASFPVLRHIRRAWSKFPNTPEYEEYARNKDGKLTPNDENKTEIK